MANDDMTLVREFAANRSEPAFAALVERHVSLVHSAALRQVGDAHLAEEITQAVFIILARKASSFNASTVLSAWLYRTTHYAAADALKLQRRRRQREQEAYMQSILNEPDSGAWEQLAPMLDDAMNRLDDRDRTALVLRFFENKTAPEIAISLHMSEEAAQKRVTRALEKLRKIFNKRGVTLTTAIIASAVSANSLQATPAGLAATVATTATKATSISATITTLVKGAMKTMTWVKIKFAASVATAALLAGGAATVAVSEISSRAPSSSMTNAAGQQPQIMIQALFVKASDATMAAISTEAFAHPEKPIDLQSQSFQEQLKRHRDAEIIAAPGLVTVNGRQGEIFIGDQYATPGGTNARVGITLDVMPTLKPGPLIQLNIKAESVEQVKGQAALSRSTTTTELSLVPDAVAVSTFGNHDSPAAQGDGKKLHMFISAVLIDAAGNRFQERLQTAKAPPPQSTRTYKLSEAFFSGLSRAAASKDGESRFDQIKRWLKQEGLEFNPPEAISLNDQKRELLTRTSADKQDKLERAIARIQNPP